MSAPTGLEVRTTDLAIPQKKTHTPIDVKIEHFAAQAHVRITSRDNRVAMLAPAALVERKFPKGALPKVSYFRAQIGGAGTLEIVERFFPPESKQW